jgi:hypothetical protein
VPNCLDFLVVLDEHLAASSLDYVIYGHELYGIAESAGLCARGSEQPAQWIGELVSRGYVTHGPLGGGDRRLLPEGPWTGYDVRRVGDYRVTYEGRTEADRVRQQRRARLTDAALGGPGLDLVRPWMDDPQRRAVTTPLTHLRSALDAEQFVSAVGAAKDLTEAACKVAIEHGGGTAPVAASLPALFKEVMGVSGLDPGYGALLSIWG